MNRLRVGVISVAAVAVAALMLVVGPSWALGSVRSHTAAVAPTMCAPAAAAAGTGNEGSTTVAPSDMAGVPGTMAGMPAMAGSSPSHHSMQELRDRLARTPSGGTLTVPSGVYGGALVIDRPVTLVGVGNPILAGDGTGTVLTIRAAGTTVRDLTIEGSGPGPVDNPAGVSVQADRVTVKHLHIRDTYTGIWVEGVSDAHILGNVIEGRKQVAASGESPRMTSDTAGMVMGAAMPGRGDGVSLYNAIRPVVSGNTISDVRDGIYMEYGSAERLECNSVVRGRYAIHEMYAVDVTVTGNRFTADESGPVMMYGGPVTLQGNVIRDEQSPDTGYGALFLDVSAVRLLRNVIVSDRVGVQIEGPQGDPQPTAVELNTIALNQVGVGLFPDANAILSQNSLVENTVQVLGLGPDGNGGTSAWSSHGVGNYWSDYRGYQRPGNAIGQTAEVEGAAAGNLLANDPDLMALASSPSFALLRAVEERMAGQQPVSVDRFPIVDPRSPSLPSQPSATVHMALGTGLLGATSLAVCSLVLLGCTRRRRPHLGRPTL